MHGLLLIALAYHVVVVRSQSLCNNGEKQALGNSDDADNKDPDPLDVGTYILLDETIFTMTCCGQVGTWQLTTKAAGDIHMQIWRPVTGQILRMIGENVITVTDTNKKKNSYVIPAANQITFKPGDVVAVLMYKDCPTGSNSNACQDSVYAENGIAPVVTTTAQFSSFHYDTVDNDKSRGYAISIRAVQSLIPACSDGTITVADTFTGLLFTVTGSNVVTNDDDITYTLSATTLTVALTRITAVQAEISTTGTLAALFPSTAYSLTVKIADVCGASSTCQQSLTVTFTNYPMTVTSLPNTVSIPEITTTTTLLHTVTWTDANVGDRATCSISNVLPVSGLTKFLISETAPLSGTWEIYSVTNPSFDFEVDATFVLNIQCDDLYDSSDTDTLTVQITPNQPPLFNNIPDYICVSAKTTGLGVTLYTVTTSDTDDVSTNININVTITPDPSPFFISQAGYEARMITSASLLSEETQLYTLSFCVWDLRSTVCGTILQICLTEINIKPFINDLPLTILVPEDTGGGSQIYNVDVTDPNTDDVLTYSMSVQPLSTSTSFNLVINTGQLFLNIGSNFDFETVTQYNISFSVDDGIHTALESKVLYISIYDVNEAPVFTTTTFSLTKEEADAGTTIGTPAFVCTDVDQVDSQTYRISGGDTYGRFSMASDGQLSFAQDYDVDQGAMPTSVTLFVQCVDNGGLSDTATLIVAIHDGNDNAPIFQQSSHSISVNIGSKLNTALTTVSATDVDSGVNGQFNYFIAGVGIGQEYFIVNSVGSVMLKKSIDFAKDMSFTFTIFADDHGSPSLRGYTRVSVTFIQTTTVYTPVTTPMPCFFCTVGGIAVFTLLMMVAVFLLFFGAYLIFNYCLRNAVLGGAMRAFCVRCLQGPQRRPPPPLQFQAQAQPRQQLQNLPVRSYRMPSAHAKPPTPPPPPVRRGTYTNPFWNNRDFELNSSDPRPVGYYPGYRIVW